jgi:hypothetical protein
LQPRSTPEEDDKKRAAPARRVEVVMLGRAVRWVALGVVAAPLVACSDGGGNAGGEGGESSTSTETSGTQSTGTNNFATSSVSTGVAPECTTNPECPMGEICSAGQCVPGCAGDNPCPVGEACCSGTCIDPANDVLNCGSCDEACPTAENVQTTCVMGECGFGMCDAGYNDCDGSYDNGCETMGGCACVPGSTQACYQGPPGTENIGTCVGGMQTCNANGTAWGPCLGQVLPVDEVCADGQDNDCNQLTDDSIDADGDGWQVCDGDCCDEIGIVCGNPELVNPGAYEYTGNIVDDDCDLGTPDAVAPPDCSTVAKFSGMTGSDVIQAMDLCQTTTANAPLPQKKWGVISTDFRLPNGGAAGGQLANMQSFQSAVMTMYGNGSNVPQKGPTFAGISSGRMRDSNDTGYVAPNTGTNFNALSTPPANYLAQHGGALPGSASCYGNCPAGSGAWDGINVRAEIRVPTNAQSFSYKFRFFSSEFWNWSCTEFNDFYLALLTSAAPGIPADKNISFDSVNNPVSVNNGFFDVCQQRGCQLCPAGTGALAGTGMENGDFDDSYGSGVTGGATNWLVTTAPVVPGETMTIEFTVFDVSDGNLDSLTLLDAFEWSVTPSTVGTVED